MKSENLVGDGDQPVVEGRLVEVGEAVDVRGDPVTGFDHVTCDLRLHGIHVVNQRRRRNDAAQIDRGRAQQHDQIEM
jgi:hypothetical protein